MPQQACFQHRLVSAGQLDSAASPGSTRYIPTPKRLPNEQDARKATQFFREAPRCRRGLSLRRSGARSHMWPLIHAPMRTTCTGGNSPSCSAGCALPAPRLRSQPCQRSFEVCAVVSFCFAKFALCLQMTQRVAWRHLRASPTPFGSVGPCHPRRPWTQWWRLLESDSLVSSQERWRCRPRIA